MRLFKTIAALAVIIVSMKTYGQSQIVSGKVTDQAGVTVPNASVRIVGTKTGTSADPMATSKLR